MSAMPHPRTRSTPSPTLTPRGLLVAYLLVAAPLALLLAASEPVLAAAVAAGAVGAVAVQLGLAYAVSRRDGGRRRRVRIPLTRLCVEV